MRPYTHWEGFQYSKFVILCCIVGKIKVNRWRGGVARQNQQYWYKGTVLQGRRYKNTNDVTMEVLRRLLILGSIPASHSIKRENLRL